MTLEEIGNLLESTGIPTTYRMWPTEQPLPYICYLVSYSNNFAADGIVYDKINHVQIELYTARKDLQTEKLIEDALTSSGIFWEYTEIYLEGEQCYQITYEIEV